MSRALPPPALRLVPLAEVRPDPTQPRQVFDPAALDDLAASIREKGQLTPVDVRADPENPERFILIAGERRYQALLRLGAIEILVIVRATADPGEVLDHQIIENVQRQAMTPLEEARAYQRRLDQLGGDHAELARRLGLKQAWRITERTYLLKMLPEYQKLFESGNISNSAAYFLGQLNPPNQKKLFEGIRVGKLTSWSALRAAYQALVDSERQVALFDLPTPTAEETAAVQAMERRIDKAVAVLRDGFDDNQIVILQRIDPGKAATYADKLALMRKHLAQLENALRAATVLNLVAPLPGLA